MRGDISRLRSGNAVAKGYAGVLMQQGRLLTDSDWNEAVEIDAYRSETALSDLIGRHGAPKDEPGFAITPGDGGFAIGPGRYYAGGLLLENPAATTYDGQDGALSLDPFTNGIDDGAEILIYLEARKRHVTAMEDPLLAEPALAGSDTTTRLQADWRIRAQPITLTAPQRDALIETARCGGLPDIAGWAPGTGRMRAGTAPAADPPDDTDCLVPPEAGYFSQENQCYRVQIVQGGTRAQARFVWSRENGSVQAILTRNADGAFILRGQRDDEALGFVSGGWVEVFDERDEALGRTGKLTRMSLDGDIATFDRSISDFDQMVNPRLRRWDHGGNSNLGVPLSTTAVDLERGVQVSFTNGSYRQGDFWVFEARAATGTVIWPPQPSGNPDDPLPPMGWGRHFAPLALATRRDDGIGDVIDLRALFPALTCLEAEDVGFDDDACQLGADTVQEALEVLCQRTGGVGRCTIVAGTASELIGAISALSQGDSVRICLRGGQFPLPRTLIFEKLGHVIVEGTGPQTVISTAKGEAAFLFRNCASVRMSDLSINGGPTGSDGQDQRDGRLGAVTVIDTGDVAFERLRVRCRAGLDRASACISTRGDRRTGTVLVRDCTCRVGQAQIGINIIGARRAIVQDNWLEPVPAPSSQVTRRIIADPVLVARMSRGMLWFRDSMPSNLGNVSVIPAPRGPGDNILGRAESRPLNRLRASAERVSFPLQRGNRAVNAFVVNHVASALINAISRNTANRIDDEREMRRHLRNVLAEAIRNNGRAGVGGGFARIFDAGTLAMARTAYMAQGIVIAGRTVQEAKVTGNRIERAIDGIRLAASSRSDPLPPSWKRARPINTVARATVNANTITVLPLSNVTSAHGIYAGHVDRMTAHQNEVVGAGSPPSPNLITPHFGMYQFGFRGDQITWTENMIRRLHHGLAIMPELDDRLFGIWRMRDNAAIGTVQAYAIASGVKIF